MDGFWTFAAHAPLTAVIVTFLLVYGATYPLRAAVRAYKSKQLTQRIKDHGWPPSHIDGHGDAIKKDDDE